MRSLIYGNLYSRRASASAAGDNYAFPRILSGQQWTVALRFLDRIDGSNTEVFPAIRSIRGSIGLADARPVSGTLKWQAGSGVSTADNTTSAFDRDAEPYEIEERLNALAAFPSDFSVDFDNGSYLVRRATGEKVVIVPRENRMSPVSFARVRHYQESGGKWVTEIRNVQAPFAFTDTAEPVLPPKPSIKTISDGHTESTWKVNEKQRLTIPPDFRGQYFFRQDLKKSNLLSLADGAEEIKAALDAMLEAEGGFVTVENVDDGIADIVFLGDLSGIDVPEMTIDVPPEGAPPGDWTFTLDLDRGEVWAALREKDSIPVLFEIELEIWLDENNHDAGTKIVKIWSDTVTLARPLLWEGLASEQNIDWLRPPSPKDYRRFSLDTIITGQQHYVSLPFGDGFQTGFVFDHNLATSAISGFEVINVETGAFLVRGTDYTIPASDENTATLELTVPPAVNQLRAILTTAGPVSQFIANLTVEIDQVTGLQAIIDDFSTRIATLESVLPSTGPGSTSSAKGTITIPLPETAEVLFSKTLLQISEKGGPQNLPSRPPFLLPAIHTATNATALPDPLPDPTAVDAGTLYVNSGASDVLIPIGGQIRSGIVKPGGFVGCDHRVLYPASRDGTTKSYYPAAFERELFMFYISEKMLRVGRTLECVFGVQMQLVAANSRASWVLEIQTGTAPQDVEPAATGPNLQNIAWNAAPVLRERIVISHLLIPHTFGVRIKRLSGGMALDMQQYGVWEGNNDAAPAGASFVLRARLINFDTENSVPTAKGWLFYQLIGGAETDEEGNQKTTPAKATIS